MVIGILTQDNNTSFILDESDDRHFEDRIIWSGYLTHWSGDKIHTRELKQHDYENNEPVIIIWPVESSSTEPFVDLKYEKLPQLIVPEAPMSMVSPLLNFRNYFRKNRLRIF